MKEYDWLDYLDRYADVARHYGTDDPSMSQEEKIEKAKHHYEVFGKDEGRELNVLSVPQGQSGKDDYFNVDQFEGLLSRLEASKGRQQRQKSVEGRRDTFAKGLAGMMGNF